MRQSEARMHEPASTRRGSGSGGGGDTATRHQRRQHSQRGNEGTRRRRCAASASALGRFPRLDWCWSVSTGQGVIRLRRFLLRGGGLKGGR
eukprot:364741-Chlamydomonas_euryale.AAC.10